MVSTEHIGCATLCSSGVSSPLSSEVSSMLLVSSWGSRPSKIYPQSPQTESPQTGHTVVSVDTGASSDNSHYNKEYFESTPHGSFALQCSLMLIYFCFNVVFTIFSQQLATTTSSTPIGMMIPSAIASFWLMLYSKNPKALKRNRTSLFRGALGQFGDFLLALGIGLTSPLVGSITCQLIPCLTYLLHTARNREQEEVNIRVLSSFILVALSATALLLEYSRTTAVITTAGLLLLVTSTLCNSAQGVFLEELLKSRADTTDTSPISKAAADLAGSSTFLVIVGLGMWPFTTIKTKAFINGVILGCIWLGYCGTNIIIAKRVNNSATKLSLLKTLAVIPIVAWEMLSTGTCDGFTLILVAIVIGTCLQSATHL